MVAETAGDQEVNLALDQLVQADGLLHPQTDFRVRAAKLCQVEAAQVEAAMDPPIAAAHRACRFQWRGRVRDATKPSEIPGR